VRSQLLLSTQKVVGSSRARESPGFFWLFRRAFWPAKGSPAAIRRSHYLFIT
jgi:hypothetical protein